MKLTRALPVLAALAIAAASGLSPIRAESSTPAPGDYTVDQAVNGAMLYVTKCSSCHGATLRGPAGPALIGNAFTSQWTGEAAEDVYAMMSKNMPLTAPGSLKPDESLAIMAFILQQNKFPVGSTPLTEAKLKTIKLVAPRN